MLLYLIACPAVFLAGFVDSIAGGGGLISLPAYMIAGLPAHTAVATNKLSSAMGTTVSTIHYLKSGFMKWKICLPGILTAIIGSWCGARLNLITSERGLQIMMLICLPVIAFYVLRNKNLAASSGEAFSMKKTIALCSLISLVIGVYDGIYGPGTGTFLILLFTGACHLSMEDAAGTTKAINLTTNIASLTVYLLHGNVLIPLGLACGVCNMLGNYIGSHCFTSKGTGFVRPVILVVLVIFFIRIIYQIVGGGF